MSFGSSTAANPPHQACACRSALRNCSYCGVLTVFFGLRMRSAGFGQPGAWWIHINHGYEVKPKLAKYIRKQGIDVLSGEYREISCKSAVMCFGLSAQRVSNNSSHKPFNIWLSPYVTGSQVMLPLKIGASVANMDIADMATLIPKGWGAPGMNGITTWAAGN